MPVQVSFEKEHKCKAIENIECVFIQTLLIDNRHGWFWHHIEHMNTLEEKIICHEIKFCPYCGHELD
ncbi:hypothetical protein SOV_22760 [Sporomusa ovata DSM 2662]|uniref:hypothetical protein n=1 Tax=Sporomusa ovata TaxID=2378 RepID=UPI00038829E9|nr:hypothetical protein [Sporomusa ovata]EQB25592.1 hypothetical protein SOV_4c02550 [Sporomusa ovata DSM 2662]